MRLWWRREIFQSTLSVRRATLPESESESSMAISIHALRKESDAALVNRIGGTYVFQSTLSVRRATPVSRGGDPLA